MPALNFQEIRDVLRTQLADIIGTYTLPNGSTLPAIRLSDGSDIPSEATVSGVEIVVMFSPTANIRYYIGGAYTQTSQGMVYLYQHDITLNAIDYLPRLIDALNTIDPSILTVRSNEITGTHRSAALDSVAQLVVPFEFT